MKCLGVRISVKLLSLSEREIFSFVVDLIPVCGVKGLACLSQYSQMLITLRTKKGKLSCNCLPQCKDIRYTVDSETVRSW